MKSTWKYSVFLREIELSKGEGVRQPPSLRREGNARVSTYDELE